ncbi:MAG: hypothetical protein JRG74_16150 [Deltaproteobacteria bacterium]|nr:hypothetical protein [Deltaproteobacteria bacterium]
MGSTVAPCSKLIRVKSRLDPPDDHFGVRSNYKALEAAFEYAEKAWRCWLGRRHRDGYISCEKFKRILERVPLPLFEVNTSFILLAKLVAKSMAGG